MTRFNSPEQKPAPLSLEEVVAHSQDLLAPSPYRLGDSYRPVLKRRIGHMLRGHFTRMEAGIEFGILPRADQHPPLLPFGISPPIADILVARSQVGMVRSASCRFWQGREVRATLAEYTAADLIMPDGAVVEATPHLGKIHATSVRPRTDSPLYVLGAAAPSADGHPPYIDLDSIVYSGNDVLSYIQGFTHKTTENGALDRGGALQTIAGYLAIMSNIN